MLYQGDLYMKKEHKTLSVSCRKPYVMRVCTIIVKFLVVLVSLVILFKGQLTSLVSGILDKITSQSKRIFDKLTDLLPYKEV